METGQLKETYGQYFESTWSYVTKGLLHPVTHIIYDHPTMPAADYPTEEETARSYPNPCGYATGTEDGMLYGGTVLDACVAFLEKSCAADGALSDLEETLRSADALETADALQTAEVLRIAEAVAEGMLNCAESAASPGFLPRSVMPCDGKSHYIDSSRDQYTMYVFGAVRYMKSGLCPEALKRRFEQVLEGFAARALKNVTPENGYDLLREDGGPTLNNVMWSDDKSIGNHEALRLPMLYLAGYEAAGRKAYLSAYLALFEEAYARSLAFPEPPDENSTGYWHLYALQQMQASVIVCRMLDPDPHRRTLLEALSAKISGYVAAHAAPYIEGYRRVTEACVPYRCYREYPLITEDKPVWEGLPQFRNQRDDTDDFFSLQDVAQLLLIPLYASETAAAKATGDEWPGADLGVTIPEEFVSLFSEALSRVDPAQYTGPVLVHYLAVLARL